MLDAAASGSWIDFVASTSISPELEAGCVETSPARTISSLPDIEVESRCQRGKGSLNPWTIGQVF